MTLDEPTSRSLFASAKIARLATIGKDGHPHLVPIVFAIVGDHILSAVDQKPKRSRRLARLKNIEANPRVSLLADHYQDDWQHLWWVRADGLARIVPADSVSSSSVEALVERYPPYASDPPAGPYIDVMVERWIGWRAGA